MKAAFHLLTLVVSLFNLGFVPVVNASTAQFLCSEVPCVEDVTDTTCDQLVMDYDFIADGCCFSLRDNGSGGCLVTIEGNSSLGSCARQARVDPFSVGETPGEVSALAGMLLSYTIDGTLPDECPTSDYAVETSSAKSVLPTVIMRLQGVGNAWTEQDTTDWKALTEAHTVDFFTTNPEYGYRHVLTYIDVYPNGGAIWDGDKDTVTLLYLQFVSFRVNPDATNLVNSTVSELLDIAFSSPTGHSTYLSAIQGSSSPTLSPVEEFSFNTTGELPEGEGSVATRDPVATPTTAPGADSASSAASIFKWGRHLFIVSALVMGLISRN
jgi:hypothetical protein